MTNDLFKKTRKKLGRTLSDAELNGVAAGYRPQDVCTGNSCLEIVDAAALEQVRTVTGPGAGNPILETTVSNTAPLITRRR